jgi:hypothetical protein
LGSISQPHELYFNNENELKGFYRKGFYGIII